MLAPTLLKVPIRQGRQLVELTAPGPAELAVFKEQGAQASNRVGANAPGLQGLEITRVVGTFGQPYPTTVRNVTDPPELEKGAGAAAPCPAFMTDVAVELVLGPS